MFIFFMKSKFFFSFSPRIDCIRRGHGQSSRRSQNLCFHCQTKRIIIFRSQSFTSLEAQTDFLQLAGAFKMGHFFEGIVPLRHCWYINTNKKKMIGSLERMLPHIKDVYQLCIVSYTLALMKSSEADLAFSKLMNSFSESDGKIYWSPTPITVNR